MKKLSILTIVIIVLAMAIPAVAGVESWGDLYYRNNAPAGTYNPTYTGSLWDWPAVYTNDGAPIAMPTVQLYDSTGTAIIASAGGQVDSLAGDTLNAGAKLLIGFENYHLKDWDKFVTLRIKHTGGQVLQVDAYAAGKQVAESITPLKVWEYYGENGDYILVLKIVPQPDWEWIAVKNTSGGYIVLNYVAIGTHCFNKVPSLTTYGLLLLVLLLAGTAVWIIRRRSAVAVV